MAVGWLLLLAALGTRIHGAGQVSASVPGTSAPVVAGRQGIVALGLLIAGLACRHRVAAMNRSRPPEGGHYDKGRGGYLAAARFRGSLFRPRAVAAGGLFPRILRRALRLAIAGRLLAAGIRPCGLRLPRCLRGAAPLPRVYVTVSPEPVGAIRQMARGLELPLHDPITRPMDSGRSNEQRIVRRVLTARGTRLRLPGHSTILLAGCVRFRHGYGGTKPRSDLSKQRAKVLLCLGKMREVAAKIVLALLFLQVATPSVSTAQTAAAARQPDPIRYTIRFPAPHTHYMEVTASVPTGGKPEVELMMAVWTPGSYLVREYQRNVERLTATNAGDRWRWRNRTRTAGASRPAARRRSPLRTVSTHTKCRCAPTGGGALRADQRGADLHDPRRRRRPPA